MTLRRQLVTGSLLVWLAGCGGAPVAGGSNRAEPAAADPKPQRMEAPAQPSAVTNRRSEPASPSAASGELRFTVRDYARRQERRIRFGLSEGVFRGEGDDTQRIEDLLRSFAALLHGREASTGFARRVVLGGQPVPGFPKLGEPEAVDHVVERIPGSPRVRMHFDEVGMVVAVQVFDGEGDEPAAVLRVTSWAGLGGMQVPTGFASTSGLEIEVFDLELR